MDGLRILIVMEEAILSLGLQVQLTIWGFTKVEIVKTSLEALTSTTYHLPSLTLLDEKIITEKNNLHTHELISRLQYSPIILISKDLADNYMIHQQLQRETNYLLLCKPCTETDLKKAVEHLLGIIIPAA